MRLASHSVTTPAEHEDGLALFISREWRHRFRESLALPKRRVKVLRRLAHFRHLDHRFTTEVTKSEQKSSILGSALRARGAGERCYLVSESYDLDGREMSLDEALTELVDHDSGIATFVSCVPGRLAYFHDEEVDNRYILERSE
jgi:hypothetical protein